MSPPVDAKTLFLSISYCSTSTTTHFYITHVTKEAPACINSGYYCFVVPHRLQSMVVTYVNSKYVGVFELIRDFITKLIALLSTVDSRIRFERHLNMHNPFFSHWN